MILYHLTCFIFAGLALTQATSNSTNSTNGGPDPDFEKIPSNFDPNSYQPNVPGKTIKLVDDEQREDEPTGRSDNTPAIFTYQVTLGTSDGNPVVPMEIGSANRHPFLVKAKEYAAQQFLRKAAPDLNTPVRYFNYTSGDLSFLVVYKGPYPFSWLQVAFVLDRLANATLPGGPFDGFNTSIIFNGNDKMGTSQIYGALLSSFDILTGNDTQTELQVDEASNGLVPAGGGRRLIKRQDDSEKATNVIPPPDGQLNSLNEDPDPNPLDRLHPRVFKRQDDAKTGYNDKNASSPDARLNPPSAALAAGEGDLKPLPKRQAFDKTVSNHSSTYHPSDYLDPVALAEAVKPLPKRQASAKNVSNVGPPDGQIQAPDSAPGAINPLVKRQATEEDITLNSSSLHPDGQTNAPAPAEAVNPLPKRDAIIPMNISTPADPNEGRLQVLVSPSQSPVPAPPPIGGRRRLIKRDGDDAKHNSTTLTTDENATPNQLLQSDPGPPSSSQPSPNNNNQVANPLPKRANNNDYQITFCPNREFILRLVPTTGTVLYRILNSLIVAAYNEIVMTNFPGQTPPPPPVNFHEVRARFFGTPEDINIPGNIYQFRSSGAGVSPVVYQAAVHALAAFADEFHWDGAAGSRSGFTAEILDKGTRALLGTIGLGVRAAIVQSQCFVQNPDGSLLLGCLRRDEL